MDKSVQRYFAHASACIDEGAAVGENSKIWHFSHIMAGASIGRNVTIGQNVMVAAGCTVGNNVKIQNNVSIYTGVTLEDDVFCGPSMVFTNVINPRSYIERKDEFRPTRVKRGASIGANATIVCGCTLGSYCLIGAGAVVTRDVPAYGLVVGNPGRLTGFVCYCGEKLIQADAGIATEQASSPDLAGSSLIEQSSLDLLCQCCNRSYAKQGLELKLTDLQG